MPRLDQDEVDMIAKAINHLLASALAGEWVYEEDDVIPLGDEIERLLLSEKTPENLAYVLATAPARR